MLHSTIGLVLLVLGVFGLITWWEDFGLVLRGLIPFLLVLGGLVAIGAALSVGKAEDTKNESKDTG